MCDGWQLVALLNKGHLKHVSSEVESMLFWASALIKSTFPSKFENYTCQKYVIATAMHYFFYIGVGDTWFVIIKTWKHIPAKWNPGMCLKQLQKSYHWLIAGLLFRYNEWVPEEDIASNAEERDEEDIQALLQVCMYQINLSLLQDTPCYHVLKNKQKQKQKPK